MMKYFVAKVVNELKCAISLHFDSYYSLLITVDHKDWPNKVEFKIYFQHRKHLKTTTINLRNENITEEYKSSVKKHLIPINLKSPCIVGTVPKQL